MACLAMDETKGVVRMRLIDADRLKDVPMFNGRYDKENASEQFIFGIETVIDFINELPTIPYDMKWNQDCKDCRPEDISECTLCRLKDDIGF